MHEPREHHIHRRQQREVVQRRQPRILAEIATGRPHVEQRHMLTEHLLRSAVQDRRPRLPDHRRHRHDAAVQIRDPGFGGPGGQLPRLPGLGRGHIDHGPSGQVTGERAEHLAHRVVIEQAGDHQPARPDRLAGRRRLRRALRDERIRLPRRPVPHHGGKPGLHQSPSKGAAHRAQPEDTHLGAVVVLRHVTTPLPRSQKLPDASILSTTSRVDQYGLISAVLTFR